MAIVVERLYGMPELEEADKLVVSVVGLGYAVKEIVDPSTVTVEPGRVRVVVGSTVFER